MPQAALLDGLNLDSALSDLIAAAPMPTVGAGVLHRATSDALRQWLKSHSELPESCRAGLWLLAGDLNKSHSISQNIPSPDGSFWHGIMHRREGDYENAKYWFRRVGTHPVLAALSEEIAALQARSSQAALPWERLSDAHQVALALVDACRSGRSELLEAIGWLEWQLLFAHCWRQEQEKT
jgi:hypothetical protein